MSDSGPLWQLPIEIFPPTPDEFDHPWLACDPSRRHLYGTYTRIGSSVGFRIEFVRSLDGGLTWSSPQVLSGLEWANGSKTVVGPDGELYIFWIQQLTGKVLFRKSLDFGATFGSEVEVATIQQNLASGPPGYRHYSGRDPGTQFPAIDIDRTTGPHRGTIYLVWPERATGTLSPLLSSIGESGYNDYFIGATPIEIGQDLYGTLLSSDLPPYQGDGDIVRFEGTAGTTLVMDWQLSARGFVSGFVGMFYTIFCGPDTTQLGAVADGFVPEINEGAAHSTVFTVPRTGPYYVVLGGSSGPYHLDWLLSLRALTPDPQSVARDLRDLVLIASADGGSSWSPRQRVNDDPPQYDNSLPDLTVDAQGRVHVAWYDRRDDPDCSLLAQVYHARSAGGTSPFSPATKVTSVGSSWQFFLSEYPSNIGGHLAVLPHNGRALVLWTDSRRGDPSDIFGAWVEDDGTSTLIPRFEAVYGEGAVQLRWSTLAGAEFEGFRLHRAEAGSEAFLPLMEEAIPSRGTSYEWSDATVVPGHAYDFRLEAIHGPGASTWEGPIRVQIPGEAARFAWRSASPNPFRERITLELTAPAFNRCTFAIHDVRGREVLTTTREATDGTARLVWDGRESRGRMVPAGLYFVRVTLGSSHLDLRILKLD
jgi:hypothetical protein